ncbi:MAG: lactonase family protein [Bacteroidota bacterium]
MKFWLNTTILTLLLLSVLAACYQPPKDPQGMKEAKLWAGTYTRTEGHVDGKAEGIYGLLYRRKKLNITHTHEDIVNPSFLTLDPTREVLYAVSEIGPDVDTTGFVYSYRIEEGQLVLQNRQPTHSFAPCHVSVHPDGEWLYVANYVGGVIARYPLAADGQIKAVSDIKRLAGQGPNPRQESSHPHSITVSPEGNWVIVADLGTDYLHTYQADLPTWELVSTTELPAGSGPRHLAFHPKAPFAYVLNELNNTVSLLEYNSQNGALNLLDFCYTLPEGADSTSLGADIHLTPDGAFLYVSNRGHNSLAGFAVDRETGTLTNIGHWPTRGDFPRNFVIHPEGEDLLVANQNTDNISQFRIDKETGQLKHLREWTVKTPVCLQFEE